MNIIEKLGYWLQAEMQEPLAFGWFHILCIVITLSSILILYKYKNNHNEKQLKIILGIYGIISLILELAKQLLYSFNYDELTQIVTWDYQWYAAPFQFCSTPMYIAIICLFLKNNTLRKSLLSYIAFFTILGSIAVIVLPDGCLIENIATNIQTMWLHCGSFVISIYLLISKEIEISLQNFKKGFVTFLVFVGIANSLNIIVYNLGILNGEKFNMFYISPYFISSLMVFDKIQESTPYIMFLGIYILALTLGATIIFNIAKLIKYINNKGLCK